MYALRFARPPVQAAAQRLFVLWVGLHLLAAGLPPAEAGEAEVAGFDGFLRGIVAEWEVPGLAVAAVAGGEVVLCRAYGFRDPERRLPATPRTLFALGSVTKTFTATGLALLAEEGRLDWDRPVRNYLPDFALLDPEAGRRITPRDLVSHRSGLPRHDVLWYAQAFDRAELLRRLRHLKPTKALGETFQYQNLMFMAAGAVAGRLSGATWEDFTRRRLLEPLGMAATRLSLARFLAAPEIALPYFAGEDGRESIAFRDTDEIAPAAAAYTNVMDMLRYLRFHLSRGDAAGGRLLSPGAAAAMWRVQTPFAPATGDYVTRGYGLGFYVSSYRGRRLIHHGGAIDGYTAHFSFMPEADLGVVVLSNLSGGNPVPRLAALNLYDRLLGLAPIPWAEKRREADRRRKAAPPRQVLPVPPAQATPPSLDLGAYAGAYEHPAYGVIRIEVEDGSLAGRFNDIGFALSHLDGELWYVPETAWPLREGLLVRFMVKERGQVTGLATPIADGPSYRFNPGEMVFTRPR